MAIINTLQKCLDSPYLFEDKEAPTRIVELLSKAGDRLDGAVNIHTSGQGDPADVVFLSYEAMFCCLRHLSMPRAIASMAYAACSWHAKVFMSAPVSSMPNTCANSSRPSGSNCHPPMPSKPAPPSSSEHSSCSGSKRQKMT